MNVYLVNFFDSWSSSSASTCSWGWSTWHTSTRHSTGHATRHTSWHTTWCTTSLLIQLSYNRIANTLNFLLFVLKFVNFCQLICIKPFNGFIALLGDSLFVTVANFVLEFFIISLVLLCITNHFLNFLF